jgi:hypothetical protein
MIKIKIYYIIDQIKKHQCYYLDIYLITLQILTQSTVNLNLVKFTFILYYFKNRIHFNSQNLSKVMLVDMEKKDRLFPTVVIIIMLKRLLML